jgi:restriction endonuclease S subunit
MDSVPDRYWARAGDVLFRSRGDKNTATALGALFRDSAVAVMPLVILRPKADWLDPSYLAWCINQPSAQRHFDECARGTGIRMIPIGCLSSLEIPLPDLATQHAIAEVSQLAEREHTLAIRLADRRRQLTAFALHERANRISSNQNGESSKAAPRSGKQGE